MWAVEFPVQSRSGNGSPTSSVDFARSVIHTANQIVNSLASKDSVGR